MVNVLEVHLALSGRMRQPARRDESKLSRPSWAFEGTTALAGLQVLTSGKKLDAASHFSYILKRLDLSVLRVGMFKEATTAPFCKSLQKRGFILRPLRPKKV
ncbi:MAG: hypothetical protein JO034_19735 [Singulisphaera sp.]|nr:hypothetical protein [Singulisphaera sp.]